MLLSAVLFDLTFLPEAVLRNILCLETSMPACTVCCATFECNQAKLLIVSALRAQDRNEAGMGSTHIWVRGQLPLEVCTGRGGAAPPACGQ
jgi:hypothetical protein